jgi:hypothetical protein
LLFLEAKISSTFFRRLILVPSRCRSRTSMKLATFFCIWLLLGDNLRGDVCCWSPFYPLPPCGVLPWNPVYTRSVDPSVLDFSLSSHRHTHVSLLFNSRLIDY